MGTEEGWKFKGAHGNLFSPSRAARALYRPRTRSCSCVCSSSIATLTVARASFFRVPLSRSHSHRSKRASVSVSPDSRSGGSDSSMEERRVASQDLDPAPPTRVAVEGALHHGRYRTEGDSHAAPRPDPRARLGVPSFLLSRSRENGLLHTCV